MLSLLRHLLSPSAEQDQPPTEHDARIAACALFVELARADGEFSDEETQIILAMLSTEYGLSADDADALLAEARASADSSIDLWRFTSRLNDFYGTDEKLDIAEMLWRIVYADGRLDDHEHYLMGRLTGLLNLEHGRVMERKLRARDGAQ